MKPLRHLSGRALAFAALLLALLWPACAAAGTATFLRADNATQGNWQGVYGAEGYNVINDTQSDPAYATITPTGQLANTWAATTADPRALQQALVPTDRIAADWYSTTSYSFAINITDGLQHSLALYALDWDAAGRAQTIQIRDTATSALLDTRTVTGFSNGMWVTWNIAGSVTVTVTRTAGPDAVLSGIFFGPALAVPPPQSSGTATFLRLDTSTQGNWKGIYGAEGYNVINDTQSDPAYATVTPTGQLLYTWAASTAEPRAPLKASSPTDRIAATWYSGSSYSFTIDITDGLQHSLALYALDWDSTTRGETIQIRSTATGALLDTRTLTGFNTGMWATWNISGSVTVTVTRTAGPNAVLSGVFFGPVLPVPPPHVNGTATYITTDTTTQGSWQGVYGADGYRIIGDAQTYPLYATVLTPTTPLNYVWAASTADVRALQKAPPATDRVAGTWYSAATSFSFNVDIEDGGTHSMALYMLDWDRLGRTDTVEIRDALTNTLLESRNGTGLGNGVWLVWDISGSVLVTVIRTGAANPVIAGLFFGATFPPPPPLLARYDFEDAIWTGAAGQLIDASGNGRHGTAIGYPTLAAPQRSSPAVPGNPGSCGYARLYGPAANGSAFDITGLPVSIVPGKKTSVAFWMYWNGTASVMPVGWARYDLFFNNGSFGFNTFNSDIYGIASTGLSAGWHHVVATFTNGSVTSNELWIDGVNRALTQRTSTPVLANALVGPSLRIAGNTGDTSYRFDGLIDDLQVHTGALDAATVQAIMTGTHPCGSANPVGALNAFESATASGQITGVVHTKVAGAPFAVDVVVVDQNRSAVLSSFTGDVKVELYNAIDNSAGIDAEGCRRSWVALPGSPSAVVTLGVADGGRATITLPQVPEVWRDVRLRLSTPATGTATQIACSTDDFAIRPAAFASFTVTDGNWGAAGTTRSLTNVATSGGVVHKAGLPFTVRATAVNAAGATTVNYVGTAIPALSACGGAACGGALGSFSITATAAGGVINASATYSEAASMSLQLNDTSFASVDARDGSTAAELTISSPVVDVGRFVPDHFDVTQLTAPVLRTFDSACTSRVFTYLGQQFGFVTAPQATVLARNASGATTTNYSGALWKLASNAVAQSYSVSPVTPTLDTSAITLPTLTSNSNGTGLSVGTATDRMRLNRPAAVLAPFNANINIAWSVLDAAEAAVSGNGTIVTNSPLKFSNMAFDISREMRFGVLRMIPAYGSELIDLPAQVEAQYWDGVRMATNYADQCTALPAGAAAMSNFLGQLSACKTAIATAPATLVKGRTFLKLLKPGAGNAGSVDLALQLDLAPTGTTCTAVGGATSPAVTANMPFLLGKWNGSTLYDKNPTTRASFSTYRSPYIYWRENF